MVRGLRSRPPPASNHAYKPGHFVYSYRERLRHNTSPHLISSVDGKCVRIHAGERTGPRPFNIAQLRPAPIARHPTYDEQLSAMDSPAHTILHTEKISHGDPRAEEFSDAKRKEILGLIEKGTFRIVLKEEAGLDPNVVPSRYVLTIKHSGDEKSVYKARLALGGHRDKVKLSIVHNTYKLKASSIRLVFALATILGFDILSLDVNQTYLKSASNLKRQVYTRPESIELGPDELLQVLRPLYGLTDSGDYWCDMNSRFHVDKLRMQQSTGDFPLFFRRLCNRLVDVSGTYVDDVIQGGTHEQKRRLQALFAREFDIKLSDDKTFTYVGLECDSKDPSERRISQEKHVNCDSHFPSWTMTHYV